MKLLYKPQSIKELLSLGAHKLQISGIKSSSLEARILLEYITGKSIEYLLARFEEEVPIHQQIIFDELINRRLSIEPIAYIIASKEFYGYEFIVNNKVLIPRQDTEIIIKAVLDNNNIDSSFTILELGCGSGCISISLLLELPTSKVTATDISKEAIAVTIQNAIKHEVAERLEIIYSDWFKNLEKKEFDIIVSNPPYISYKDINYMAPETLKYEPAMALFAENNGLAAYHTIAKSAKSFLKANGKLFIEIGFNQFGTVKEIFNNYYYICKKVYQDLDGHDRVMIFTKE